jgi:hypothetical protein
LPQFSLAYETGLPAGDPVQYSKVLDYVIFREYYNVLIVFFQIVAFRRNCFFLPVCTLISNPAEYAVFVCRRQGDFKEIMSGFYSFYVISPNSGYVIPL